MAVQIIWGVLLLLFGTALAYLHRVLAIRKMPYQALAIFIMGISVIGSGLINSRKNREVKIE